jgi:hypothetical protein
LFSSLKQRGRTRNGHPGGLCEGRRIVSIGGDDVR